MDLYTRSGKTRRVRVLDGLGRVAHRIRSAVLAEPGPVRPVARSDEAALADGLPGLFGPVTDLLLEEYVAGRRHLVIVPHGGSTSPRCTCCTWAADRSPTPGR